MRVCFGVVFAALLLGACSFLEGGPSETNAVAPEVSVEGEKKLPETTERETEAPTTKPTYTQIKFNLKSRDAEPTLADKKRCTDVGGRVQRAGLMGAYHCVQDYPDGGKTCSDSSECMGQCRTTSADAVGKPGTGTCQQVDVPFGCYALVKDGVVDGGMLCVD